MNYGAPWMLHCIRMPEGVARIEYADDATVEQITESLLAELDEDAPDRTNAQGDLLPKPLRYQAVAAWARKKDGDGYRFFAEFRPRMRDMQNRLRGDSGTGATNATPKIVQLPRSES